MANNPGVLNVIFGWQADCVCTRGTGNEAPTNSILHLERCNFVPERQEEALLGTVSDSWEDQFLDSVSHLVLWARIPRLLTFATICLWSFKTYCGATSNVPKGFWRIFGDLGRPPGELTVNREDFEDRIPAGGVVFGSDTRKNSVRG